MKGTSGYFPSASFEFGWCGRAGACAIWQLFDLRISDSDCLCSQALFKNRTDGLAHKADYPGFVFDNLCNQCWNRVLHFLIRKFALLYQRGWYQRLSSTGTQIGRVLTSIDGLSTRFVFSVNGHHQWRRNKGVLHFRDELTSPIEYNSGRRWPSEGRSNRSVKPVSKRGQSPSSHWAGTINNITRTMKTTPEVIRRIGIMVSNLAWLLPWAWIKLVIMMWMGQICYRRTLYHRTELAHDSILLSRWSEKRAHRLNYIPGSLAKDWGGRISLVGHIFFSSSRAMSICFSLDRGGTKMIP